MLNTLLLNVSATWGSNRKLHFLVFWLADWLAGCLAHWLVGWLLEWLAGWLGWLAGWISWLIGWYIILNVKHHFKNTSVPWGSNPKPHFLVFWLAGWLHYSNVYNFKC